jgi:hypothetical protein
VNKKINNLLVFLICLITAPFSSHVEADILDHNIKNIADGFFLTATFSLG